MTDRSLRERVEAHLERHPDAGVANIAGALGESPAAVADVLDEDVDTTAPEVTSPRESDTEDLPVLESEPGVHAENVAEYGCWMPWQYIDGRKQPHAIYADTENTMSYSDPANWRDADAVQLACDDPRLEGPGIVLQHEDDPYADWADPFYVVDYDDVRDPETGEVHPLAAEHVDDAESYADISTSGTGVHILAKGTLPDDVKTISGAPLPDHDAFPDAEIEVYDGKRFVAMTGDHVVGTPTVATEAQEFLDDVVDAFVSEEERRPSTPRPDGEDWEPEYDSEELEDLDTTEDIQAVFDACRQVQPRDIRLDSSLTEERHDGTKSFDPSWEVSKSGTRLGWSPDVGWIYRQGDVGLDAIQVVALEERIITTEHDYPEGQEFWDAVDELRNRGARIPELEDDYDAEQTSGGISEHWPIEECEPPGLDRQSVTPEDRWEVLQGERFEEFVDAGGPVAWADDPGNGKTTNAAIGAAKRDRPHAVLFDKHQKAREFIEDDPTADDYYHLRGGAQKRGDICMDVDHNDDRDMCPEHGHVADCPHMCPIYDFAKDHEGRKRYEALAGELGPVKAHQILADELPGHDEHGHCAWLDQFDELSSEDRVVGVHQYQLLKTVQRRGSDGPQRDILVDESPDSLRSDRRVTVEDLARVGNALEGMVSNAPEDYRDALGEFARFSRDLVDAITDPDGPDALADLDAPAVDSDTITREVDIDDLPDGVDEEDVETKTVREHRGMPGEGYKKVEKAVVEETMLEESLAQCKVHYNETLIARMRDDRWSGTPLVFDALLGAAAAAGLDDESCRQAIAVPTTLDNCPWCASDIVFDNGARHCESETCDWHEDEHNITRRDGPTARARAELDLEPEEAGQPQGVFYEELPRPSDLPDSPLILDATTTKRKIAGLYQTPVDEVLVTGDEPQSFNLRATQVLDGQYHAGTIDDSESLQERIQRVIDTAADVHQSPLYVVKRSLQAHFEFPEGAPVLHYHAARGLNYNDCDAVVAIGAPHPKVEDLQREAELLAMDHSDLDAGGTEYSTRADTEDPVYRKLHFEDGDGQGRAVPTKHFSGLTGDLFEESRSKELTQVIHRTRPVLADETKHAYLLTNVPTEVPIDEVASFDELADPLEAMLPVPEGAIDLLEAVDDVIRGAGPDGFRADRLVDERDDGTISNRVEGYHRLAQLSGLDVTQRTVYNWVHALEEVGLLTPERYEQHAGVAYAVDSATLKSALSVLSSNGSFKVAAKRRLRSLLAESESGLDWLEWARRVFTLHGEQSEVVSPSGGGPSA